ncbi:DNA repair protein recA homolog 2, mitochondrial [Quercus suber]|uniref:DNA repair protein recA homolog 2, mitochondrial n=1 Tax=Quercus suber TaxID=58331 RepID=UPI0032DEE06E
MGFSLSLPLTPKPKSLQEFLTKMGFFTPSLMNHLCLNAFSRRPLLSTLLCSLHQSGRRGEVTSIATNICHLSTVAEVSEFECDELLDDIKATKKDTALRLALSRLASDFGRESMLSLQRFFSSPRAPVISTGSLKLDIALGVGGLPKGRIAEIYGRETYGKTTLALHIIEEAQKLGVENGDRMKWKLKKNGDFDICSLYNELQGPLSIVFPWKGIWKVKTPH